MTKGIDAPSILAARRVVEMLRQRLEEEVRSKRGNRRKRLTPYGFKIL
jgi:hypothetical protein